MNIGQNTAMLTATGAVALTLYNRHVWQDAFTAIRGGRKPLTGVPTTNPGAPSRITSGGISVPTPSGTDALSLAETSVASTRKDWLNLCLQFVDDVRAKLGMPTWYGVATAHDAAGMQSLTPGPAPRGAVVFFRGNPGHTGISNGGCTYTSAGITAGVDVRDYCSSPDYLGYTP